MYVEVIFVYVVRCMLYGFGDDEQPYAETVDLLEELVIDYISETVSIFKKLYSNYEQERKLLQRNLS